MDMKYIIWIIGLLMVIEGVIFIIKPDIYAKLVKWFIEKNFFIKLVALIKLAIGVLFLILANSCKLPIIIIALGLLICAGSITVLLIDTEKTKKILSLWSNRPMTVYRLTAVALVLLGALLLYAGTPV